MDETLQEDIVNFWFNECKPEQWFKKDSKFDKKISDRFSEIVELALAGKFDSWTKTETGCLSLILLLDQFTRNIFRGTSRAFEGDKKSLEISFLCKERGYLNSGDMRKCQFMLLPMMHSEEISVQNDSILLFKNLSNEKTFEYALKHREIIARFGRFPHRNTLLGRESTDEELEFLTKVGSSF